MVYIYALRCPVSGSIRYIGKAEDVHLRLIRHVATARTKQAKHHCARWIRTLLAQGLEPTIEVVHVVQAVEDWRDVERRLIAEYRAAGHLLTNQTVGGDGVSYINEQDRDAASAKLSESMRKAWSDPAKKQNMVAAARKPELLLRRSEKMKRLLADDEFVARKLAGVLRTARSPEVLQALREVAARPDVRAAKVAANKAKSPQVRAQQSATLKATWARRKAEAAASN